VKTEKKKHLQSKQPTCCGTKNITVWMRRTPKIIMMMRKALAILKTSKYIIIVHSLVSYTTTSCSYFEKNAL
jgi:hypothetical protein